MAIVLQRELNDSAQNINAMAGAIAYIYDAGYYNSGRCSIALFFVCFFLIRKAQNVRQ